MDVFLYYLSIFQLKKFNNLKAYMKNFLHYLMYQATALNLLTNILFFQLKNNKLQSIFFLNSEYEKIFIVFKKG